MISNPSLEGERASQPPRTQDFGIRILGQVRPASRSTSSVADVNAFSLAKDEPLNQDRREDEGRFVRDNPTGVMEEVIEDVEQEEDLDDMIAMITFASNKTKKKKTVKVELSKRSRHCYHYLRFRCWSRRLLPGLPWRTGGDIMSSLCSAKGGFMMSYGFSTVKILGIGKDVAIKIVRAQESMYKADLKEAQMLNKLFQADPDDKTMLFASERTFEHRGHLCIVFENLTSFIPLLSATPPRIYEVFKV